MSIPQVLINDFDLFWKVDNTKINISYNHNAMSTGIDVKYPFVLFLCILCIVLTTHRLPKIIELLLKTKEKGKSLRLCTCLFVVVDQITCMETSFSWVAILYSWLSINGRLHIKLSAVSFYWTLHHLSYWLNY